MSEKKRNKLFGRKVKAVSVGLEKFAESMKEQEVETVAVEWRPGAEVPHLTKTKSGLDIDEANAEVVRRICAGRPMLVGMGIARDTLPDMGERMILHAGPPITVVMPSSISFNLLAIASDGVVCEKMLVKPTRSASSSPCSPIA